MGFVLLSQLRRAWAPETSIMGPATHVRSQPLLPLSARDTPGQGPSPKTLVTLALC